jgi:hypothetical protein
MPPKTIKLNKKDEISSVVKRIKDMRDKEVIFEMDSSSALLRNSDHMKLMKKTAQSLGKKIWVSTDDEIGRILAKKADVLYGDDEVRMPRPRARTMKNEVKPNFSDIMSNGKAIPAPVMIKPKPKMDMDLDMEVATIPVVQSYDYEEVEEPRARFNFGTRRTKVIISSLIGLVIAALLLAIFLPSATVTVFARSESISRDFEIVVDKNLAAPDNTNLEIPGIAVSNEESLTKNFPATGTLSSGEKATGLVTLYNFTKNTLTLKATTTTLVVDGKKYLFTKDVTGIRPTGGTEENPAAGTLIPPVTVIAEQGGEAYNLPAGARFEIVNKALGNQPVFAKNTDPIAGGSTNTSATAVSQKDVDQAAAVLLNEIVATTASELSNQNGGTVKIVDSGVTKEVLAQTESREPGEAASSFDMTMIARVTGMAFKDQDVIDLVESKINEVLSNDKYLDQSANKNYTAKFKSFDAATGRGVLSVHFETTVAYKLDNQNLSKLLAGKNEAEIKEILLSKPEVDSVTVKFWPSWLSHKAPRISSKIHIESQVQSK